VGDGRNLVKRKEGHLGRRGGVERGRQGVVLGGRQGLRAHALGQC
jgi:hypothetical protein